MVLFSAPALDGDAPGLGEPLRDVAARCKLFPRQRQAIPWEANGLSLPPHEAMTPELPS